MKKLNYKLIALGSVVFLTLSYSCKKVLDKSRRWGICRRQLANKAGVDGLLIGAYSLLDGYYQGQPITANGPPVSVTGLWRCWMQMMPTKVRPR